MAIIFAKDKTLAATTCLAKDCKPDAAHCDGKKKRGRPHSGNETVTLRLSSAVLDCYRGTGKGWQARLNADLKKLAGL
ncbi:hypothetical protein GOZ96_04785 [Agrobacterium vitis]|uniref:BrnA antitoxin family protein n=1 Tax=Agrobacterium vitis TaxID=373 RepID=A0A7J4X4P7_AGRVI|nr:hypothetical protein DXT89_14080 [Agrobacterium vitis]MUZ95905.1 hypothetical protein [Agrobacterium vitis]